MVYRIRIKKYSTFNELCELRGFIQSVGRSGTVGRFFGFFENLCGKIKYGDTLEKTVPTVPTVPNVPEKTKTL